MNETKGRVLLLCLIGLFIVIILGWKHTDSLSAKTDQEEESIGVVEIALVTISPQQQNKYNRQEEYINFDLRHLAIVGKDEPSDAGQYTERDVEMPEVDGEADGTDRTGSEVDSDVMPTASGDDVEYEDDASGDSGEYAEDGIRDWDDGIDSSNDTELQGSVGEYAGDAETGYSDGFADESEVESGYNNLTYLGNYQITFYCPCSICCGQWATGCTASGVLATAWHTVACDLPFGTVLEIEGLGQFVVEDRGVSGNWIDVFVDDHQTALNLGLQYRDVYVVN